MIVVTGASKGLGKAIAEMLHQRGELVIGLSRTQNSSPFKSIYCDVNSYESIKKASRLVKNSGTPLKAIINAAGIASMDLAVTTDEATVKRLINTNLVGTIHCCQLFTPLMIRQRCGSVINFSTIAVSLALKGEAVYAASKAGVETFSRTFAREVSAFGIRVNCIAPGPINTDLLRGITANQIQEITSRQIIQAQFEKLDICNLVELLLDEKASSLSGQTLNVGGV